MYDVKMKTEREEKAEIRKINKPLMEKRRRARINACLSQLKMLVLQAMRKEGVNYSKLEKADILELTVEYLKNVQKRTVLESATHNPEVVTKYVAGYNECTNEAVRYLSSIDGVDNDMKTKLVTHLLTNARRRSSTVVNVAGGRHEVMGNSVNAAMMGATPYDNPRSTGAGTSTERDLLNDIFMRMLGQGPPHSQQSLRDPEPRVGCAVEVMPSNQFSPLNDEIRRMSNTQEMMTPLNHGTHHTVTSSHTQVAMTSPRNCVAQDRNVNISSRYPAISEQSDTLKLSTSNAHSLQNENRFSVKGLGAVDVLRRGQGSTQPTNIHSLQHLHMVSSTSRSHNFCHVRASGEDNRLSPREATIAEPYHNVSHHRSARRSDEDLCRTSPVLNENDISRRGEKLDNRRDASNDIGVGSLNLHALPCNDNDKIPGSSPAPEPVWRPF